MKFHSDSILPISPPQKKWKWGEKVHRILRFNKCYHLATAVNKSVIFLSLNSASFEVSPPSSPQAPGMKLLCHVMVSNGMSYK